MNLMDRIKNNLSDVVAFGPQFLKRHVPLLTGSPMIAVSIPGFGSLNLRPGEGDVTCVRQIFIRKDYDLSTLPAIETRVNNRYSEILKSGKIPIIIDAGANIGTATLYFSKTYPAAEIVAIEPEPGNFFVLLKTVENLTRVTALEAAIGSEPGFVSVHNPGLGWATQTTRSTGGTSIVTMGAIYKQISNGSPFIAKIDIEGFESDLFLKNTEWLDEVFVVFIEPHDWMLPGKRTSQSFQRAMALRNFELFISGENLIYVQAS